MAENFDNQSFGNFSIENTMDMGMGNAELLNDLMAPETSTSHPDDIKEITKEEPSTPSPAKKANNKQAPKSVIPSDEDDEKSDVKDDKNILADFLSNDGDDEEEEEETDASSTSKTKTPPSTENDDDGEEEGEEEVSRFTALSNDLFKLGVFNKDEDEEDINITTPEEFLERFQVEKRKGATEMVNNFIGQFGEDYQNAFDAIFVKGVSPKEYFGAYNNIVSFSEMDLSEENNQVAVIKQALSDQGFEPEDITTEVERLKNYGDLETVATKHHKVLVKKEAAKLQDLEKQSEKKLQQQQAIKQQYYQNVNSVLEEKLKTKEFDGIPINPKLAGELQDFLLVDKYKTPSGETLTDFDRTILDLKRPENHETKVKIALLLKILEKDPTLSTIQKTGVTKKSNELFGDLARQVSKSSTKSGGSKSKPTSWFV
jgi:hypothetical protein